jgi:hypothetical protein
MQTASTENEAAREPKEKSVREGVTSTERFWREAPHEPSDVTPSLMRISADYSRAIKNTNATQRNAAQNSTAQHKPNAQKKAGIAIPAKNQQIILANSRTHSPHKLCKPAA